MKEIRTWIVSYKNPMTEETIKCVEHAESKQQAALKAMEHNTPIAPGSPFFWQLESIEEPKEARP